MAQLLVFTPAGAGTPLRRYLDVLGGAPAPMNGGGVDVPALGTSATFHQGAVAGAFFTGPSTGTFARTIYRVHDLLSPAQQLGFCELLDVPALTADALRRCLLPPDGAPPPEAYAHGRAYVFDGAALAPLLPPVLTLPIAAPPSRRRVARPV